ncbi:hypothetical protein Tco_0098991 [Tanacetum coccineum]
MIGCLFLISNDFSKGSVDPTCSSVEKATNLLLISQSPRGIFINQSKYALESLKKYGYESCDPVDTPMVEKSKLDEVKEGNAVDHLLSLWGSWLVDKIHAVSTYDCIQLLGDRLVKLVLKGKKSAAISVRKLNI